MNLKEKLGRLLLSILLTGILFKSMLAFGETPTPETQYSATQTLLLNEIKKQTLELVEKQKYDAEKLRQCFAFVTVCPGDIAYKIPRIRQAIREKSEEYRLLVGLARAEHAVNGYPNVKLSLAIPGIRLRTQFLRNEPAELDLVKRIYAADLVAIEESLSPSLVPALFPLHPHVKAENLKFREELATASEFYEAQALLLATQLPFVIYMDSDRHLDSDIAKALGLHIKRVQEVLNDLYDEQKTPLESFLHFEPIVTAVISKNPDSANDLKALFFKQQTKQGFQAWVARNSPSLKLAAFTSCSLVSAILQTWPISLTCSGAVAYLTSKQLYDEYYRMRDDFALWLIGAQSHHALKGTESRLLYSTFALFLSGQAIGSTLMSIEAGLVTTLSSIPSIAAARFTSLTALREGSLRFFTRSVQWKGKDLGASLLAQDYSDITDENLKLRREQRIFTYADFLKLRQTPIQEQTP
ncbi:MAG: hypothetical protein HUU57_11920 [Bdellovibrio sp.]|nr:hypothetical protein [Bdellovibrio sp.]